MRASPAVQHVVVGLPQQPHLRQPLLVVALRGVVQAPPGATAAAAGRQAGRRRKQMSQFAWEFAAAAATDACAA